MTLDFDSKPLGEVTEAVVDKKFAKAVGVIAGALVGGGAALAGLGPTAVVPGVVSSSDTPKYFRIGRAA